MQARKEKEMIREFAGRVLHSWGVQFLLAAMAYIIFLGAIAALAYAVTAPSGWELIEPPRPGLTCWVFDGSMVWCEP